MSIGHWYVYPVTTVSLDDAHFSKFILNHLHTNLKLYIFYYSLLSAH